MVQEAASPHLLGSKGPGQGHWRGCLPPTPTPPCGCLILLPLGSAGVQCVGLLRQEGPGHLRKAPQLLSDFQRGLGASHRQGCRAGWGPENGPELLCHPSQALAYLPGETLLPLLQVSLQHCLQLLLQDAEGLPGGQAQGQGQLVLQGNKQRSACPWKKPEVPARMGFSPPPTPPYLPAPESLPPPEPLPPLAPDPRGVSKFKSPPNQEMLKYVVSPTPQSQV